jgi:hypothetical protein
LKPWRGAQVHSPRIAEVAVVAYVSLAVEEPLERLS